MSIKEGHIQGEAIIPQSDNDLGPFSEILGILIKEDIHIHIFVFYYHSDQNGVNRYYIASSCLIYIFSKNR
jgi:hypothetical protein